MAGKSTFVIAFVFTLLFIHQKTTAQTTVFSDDFSTNTNTAYTTSGNIGASSWTVLVPNADWGARRNTSPQQLELTNDASAAANVLGWVFASTSTTAFAAPYNTTLNMNPGTVTWNFNMRQIRTDPAGLGSGSYGVAFVLAGTANTTRTTGTGYAIALGQSGSTDPIRLVEYTAGLGTSTNIITSNTAGLADFGAEYLSIRVIYTPATNTWELLLRNDGNSAFADPATGVLVSQGTAVNSSFTNIPLPLLGGFWNGSTAAAQTAFFDNVSVIVGTAGPATVSIAPGVNATEGGSNGTFTISFSSPTAAITTFDYTLPAAGNATFTTDYGANIVSAPTAGATPASLAATTGTITVPAGVSIITVSIVPVDDALTEGTEPVVMTISNPGAPYIIGNASSTINIFDNEATLISQIQGAGTTAIAGNYTIEAIVTGIYPTLSPAGFYIQEEDIEWDANINTSEGIYVVSATPVAVGDRVRVTGTVQENGSTPSFNQAVVHTATVTVLSSGNPLPTATDVTLPVTAQTDFEKFEGMIVRFPGTLTVTDNENLGTFGELKLSAGGLVYQPTQIVDPNDNPAGGTNSTGNSNVAAVNALATSNALRSILLDDGRGTIPTLPYVNADNTVRVGSTITNTTGILGYAFSQYRIQPLAAAPPVINHAARPAVPVVGGNLKVISYNVLNYFNGNGAGGGFPTARGASSLAEFIRQRDKIIDALVQMNGDIVGLIELENQDLNDPTPALVDLVNGLNAVMGAGTYALIDDDLDNNGVQDNNTDLIRSAIIYKPAVVTPVGNAMLSTDPIFERPPLAQTFNYIGVNRTINFVVNHFKSKGCGGATGLNQDQLDGQSCFNFQRKQQAAALINFFNTVVIPTSGTSRIVSVGDYNSYYEEDPMDVLRAAGYITPENATDYSYMFNGQLGSLDHAVISLGLAGYVTGIAKWNTNSVEPPYLDYNDGVDDPDVSGNSDSPNPWAATYTVSPWRASDHDAIIMGLNIALTLPVTITEFSATKQNTISKLSWTTQQETNSREFIIERSLDGGRNWVQLTSVAAAGSSSSSINYTAYDPAPFKGNNLYRLKIISIDDKFEYSAIRLVNFNSAYSFTLYPNPATDRIQLNTDEPSGIHATIHVLNTQGQAVLTKTINTNLTRAIIDVTALRPGIYFLRIDSRDGTSFLQKFTKQ